MEEKYADIINRAQEIYMRYGIKSVTMDDMARHLGISKKTLYKYVTDKTDLVNKTIENQLENEMCRIKMSAESAKNAIEEHITISKSVIAQMKHVQPAVFYDLKKYYPEAWNMYQCHKHEEVFKTIKDNILSGMKEGLYREDIHPDVTAMLYIQSVDVLFSDEMVRIMSTYDFPTILIEKIKYHIYGISTEKGIKEFKKQLEKLYE
ncbi:MAG: TetR/AcrR family transcriptional regulator [Crocinitomicaceae bacterium]